MYIANDVRQATSLFRHGEITSLPFGKVGSYFKLFLQAKPETDDVKSVTVDCGMYLDGTNTSELPIVPEKWTDEFISIVTNSEVNQDILDDYRVFWVSLEENPTGN